jgi:hypothetical protein
VVVEEEGMEDEEESYYVQEGVEIEEGDAEEPSLQWSKVIPPHHS